jgi:hypothetical protein
MVRLSEGCVSTAPSSGQIHLNSQTQPSGQSHPPSGQIPHSQPISPVHTHTHQTPVTVDVTEKGLGEHKHEDADTGLTHPPSLRKDALPTSVSASIVGGSVGKYAKLHHTLPSEQEEAFPTHAVSPRVLGKPVEDLEQPSTKTRELMEMRRQADGPGCVDNGSSAGQVFFGGDVDMRGHSDCPDAGQTDSYDNKQEPGWYQENAGEMRGVEEASAGERAQHVQQTERAPQPDLASRCIHQEPETIRSKSGGESQGNHDVMRRHQGSGVPAREDDPNMNSTCGMSSHSQQGHSDDMQGRLDTGEEEEDEDSAHQQQTKVDMPAAATQEKDNSSSGTPAEIEFGDMCVFVVLLSCGSFVCGGSWCFVGRFGLGHLCFFLLEHVLR